LTSTKQASAKIVGTGISPKVNSSRLSRWLKKPVTAPSTSPINKLRHPGRRRMGLEVTGSELDMENVVDGRGRSERIRRAKLQAIRCDVIQMYMPDV
jgi:hypothetical protein